MILEKDPDLIFTVRQLDPDMGTAAVPDKILAGWPR